MVDRSFLDFMYLCPCRKFYMVDGPFAEFENFRLLGTNVSFHVLEEAGVLLAPLSCILEVPVSNLDNTKVLPEFP